MPNATTPAIQPPRPDVRSRDVDLRQSSDGIVELACEPSAITAGIVLLLDPHSILIAKDPNRLPAASNDDRDQELLLSILATGGNLVPIQVRQIGTEPHRYLLVSGERRLIACKAARLPIRAVLMTSAEPSHDCLDRLRENLGRTDLTVWEFSQQVRHAMQATQMSQSDLAKALGVSLSKVNRAVDLSDLPQLVISAFASPNDIRVVDIKRLKDAWLKDSDAVGLEVANIRENLAPLAGPQVVDLIEKAVKGQGKTRLAPCKRPLHIDGTVIGHSTSNTQGGLDLHITVAMSELQRAEIMQQVIGFVHRTVMTKPLRRTARTGERKHQAADVQRP